MYSAATQYYDATGPINYQSSFAGSYLDTNPFPASGCNDGVNAVCLTDQQVEAEIQNVLAANGWHGSTTSMFFLMTPDGVGSCFDNTSTTCTTTYPGYCAYHSGFGLNGEPVLYGNEPFGGSNPSCTGAPGQGFPNGVDVDSELNTISHEQNEAITDPWGDAWVNASQNETGDICAWNFGSPLGTVVGQPYNQVINGHDYSLQQEYSNDGSSCVQSYLGIPVNFGTPTVSGNPIQGQTLSATSGTWSQSPTSYTYQWLRCSSTSNTSCSAFTGDTGQTYQLTAADGGTILRVAVYAHNAAGTSMVAESGPTAVVVPVPAPTSSPIVSGVAVVGKTLSTTTGGWNTTANFTYQWQRCSAGGSGCAPIAGGTAASYAIVAADMGHTLQVVVSAKNVAGTGTASSATTAKVLSIPAATGAPRISGTPKIGRKLSGSHGNWRGFPATYRYQWLRCTRSGGRCVAIKRATHATYRISKHDSGHRLRLRVTAMNIAGSKTANSRPTKIVRQR
ncbi:MAG TPA: hypothetical protein VKO84_09595 [Gaiellaceae bacterium]|nr:hypothetical protein [Gaiellaceae bacterium]